MFCAGLLLSIADLLGFFELRLIHLCRGDCLGSNNVSSRPSAQGTRGENPAS